MNSWKYRRITNRKLAPEPSVPKGGVNFRMSNTICWLGSRKPVTPPVRKEVCSDWLSHCETDGESFFSRVVSGEETWILYFEPQRKRRSVELHRPILSGRYLRLPFQQGKSWSLFFGDAEGIFWSTLCDVVKPSTQICTFEFLKHRRSVSGEWDITEIFLKSIRTAQTTHVWKLRKQSQNSDGLYFSKTCSLTFPPLWSRQRCLQCEKVREWWHGCRRSG